jgi:CBS domain-containing protein
MTTNLITIKPSDKLSHVRKLFIKDYMHHLVVVENEKLVGILTTYDFLKLDRAYESYDKLEVKDIMSTKLAKVESNTKIGTAAELFLYNRFHALPVVENEDTLIGLVTSFDVLRYEFKKEYPNPILHADLYEREDKRILQGGSLK